MLLSFDQEILEVLPLLLKCGKRTHDNITYYAHPVIMCQIFALQISLACIFCLPNIGHVIILQRTVSFKFRLIYVHMLAYARTCKCTTKGQISPGPPLGKLKRSILTERFHMKSRQPYWCSKTMKRSLCWSTKNSFLV